MKRAETIGTWLLMAVLVAMLGHARLVSGANGEAGEPQNAVSSGYALDKQTGVFRAGQTVADSTTIATLTSTTTGLFSTRGRPNINVSARFVTASATVGVRLLRLTNEGKVLGISAEVTLTATSYRDLTTSYYLAPDYIFDSGGAPQVRVVVSTACSSSTVDFWVGSF